MQPQPLTPGILITLLNVTLSPQHGRNKAQTEGNLFGPGQHVVIAKNGSHPIQGSRQVRKIKPTVGSRHFTLIKDHGMGFPLQSIFDIQLLKEAPHITICAKKYMQSRFIPIPLLVLPCGHLAPQDISGLKNHRRVAGIAEVFGTSQSSQPGPSYGDTHDPSSKHAATLSAKAPAPCR